MYIFCGFFAHFLNFFFTGSDSSPGVILSGFLNDHIFPSSLISAFFTLKSGRVPVVPVFSSPALLSALVMSVAVEPVFSKGSKLGDGIVIGADPRIVSYLQKVFVSNCFFLKHFYILSIRQQ